MRPTGRHLVDHHRDRAASPQDAPCALHRARARRQHHALPSPSLLPESIDACCTKVLGHHQKGGASRDRAGREIPVAGVRGRNDRTATASHRPLPQRLGFGRQARVKVGRLTSRGQPQELHRRNTERPVHRPRSACGTVDPRRLHGLHHVRSPNAEEAPSRPADDRAEPPQHTPWQPTGDGRE
jgi:hypothetical protein